MWGVPPRAPTHTHRCRASGFELLCRDFFRLLCLKHGSRVFHGTGPIGG